MLASFFRTLRVLHKARKMFPCSTIEHGCVLKGPLNNLSLEGAVQIQSGTVIHLGGMAWCENKGSVTIANGAVVSPNCVIYGAGSGGIQIGENFDCGPGVGIFASSIDYVKGPHSHIFAPIVIGNNVMISANSVVGPGVTIGDDTIIAACSVVTSDVPSGVIAGGTPARVIRKIKD